MSCQYALFMGLLNVNTWRSVQFVDVISWRHMPSVQVGQFDFFRKGKHTNKQTNNGINIYEVWHKFLLKHTMSYLILLVVTKILKLIIQFYYYHFLSIEYIFFFFTFVVLLSHLICKPLYVLIFSFHIFFAWIVQIYKNKNKTKLKNQILQR